MTKATVQHSLNGLIVQPEITQPQTKNNGSASVSAHTVAKKSPKFVIFHVGMLRPNMSIKCKNRLFCSMAAGNPHHEIFLDLENFLTQSWES